MASITQSSVPVVSPTADVDHEDYDDYDEEDDYDDYDDYDDDDVEHKAFHKREARGLVKAAVVHGGSKKIKKKQHDRDDDEDNDDEDDDDSRYSLAPIRFQPGKCIFYTVVTIFCLSSLSIFLPSRHFQQQQQQQQQQQNQTANANHTESSLSSSSPSSSMVMYSCPSSVRKGDNYDESFEAEYVEATKQITNNMSQFAQEFRETNFDDWERTYEQVKNGMFHWKSSRFTPLQSGDSIYESACGIGLNLYMTLEILQETRNITNLVVYGNEYLTISADKANAVMDQIAPAQATKGVICPGDSTDLPFVPSNAFDLVYTGYLSPILDPLHLKMTLTENFKVYTQVCNDAHNKTSPHSAAQQAMAQKAQEEQNHWYDMWVREMIRIAKPGKAVIIEQVSPPYCDAMFDWGGVSKEWWSHSIATRWNHDLDPDSLYIEDDVIFAARYHVYMRKKEAHST